MKLIWCLLAALALGSCATVERVPLGNSGFTTRDAKVILIPMDGFNVKEVNEIAEAIEARHKFQVRTYTTLGKSSSMFNAERRQYIAEEIAGAAWEALKINGDANLERAVIVLTKDDINTKDFRLRYVFASHFDQAKLSVISTARINPASYGLPSDQGLTMHRLSKLIDKSLGLHHYGYKIGTDRKSVMYGPIMGPDDLDGVGDGY